jgi:hypothetical protein
MDINTNIIVKLTVEGFHNWPDAKTIVPEMGFLSDRHRHIFHIECRKKVTHSDRDIEIIMFKRQIKEYLEIQYGSRFCEFGAKSCEMLAAELLLQFGLEYCSVLEDGENGAEVIRQKPMSNFEKLHTPFGTK